MSNKYIALNKSIAGAGLDVNDVGFIIGEVNSYETCVELLRNQRRYNLNNSDFDLFLIENTGDMFESKVCDRCYKLLNTEACFSDNRIKKGGFKTKRPSCKSCRAVKDGVSISSKDRKYWNSIKPEVGAIFTCGICTKDSIVGITKIVLDHDHSNGRVRGWLCESCNTGIGRFDDNPELLIKALEWLKEK